MSTALGRIGRLALLSLASLSGFGCSGGSLRPAPAASPSTPAAAVELRRIERTLQLPDKEAGLQIENRYGDISVKMSDDDSVGVYALAQLIGDEPLVPELDVKTADGDLRIAVRYPSFDPERAIDRRVARTDLGVFVPAGRRVLLRTTYGTIRGKALHTPLKARSDSGRIVVSSYEAIEIESRAGQLHGGLLAAACATPVRASSVSGDIRFQLPLAASIAVAATAPSVVADFPLRAPIVAGGAHTSGSESATCRVKIRTEQGKIELYGLRE